MNVRTFIVENDSIFAVELKVKLKSWGHKVVGITNNGEKAIELIKQLKPDLILMDINIKGRLNGIEVASLTKSLNIPIIYMTCSEDRQLFQNAKKTRGISYLVKPFNILTLKGAIEFYFERQSISLTTSTDAEQEIFVRKNKELIKINPKMINWINSNGNYCVLFVKNKKYIVKKSMKQTLALLPTDEFIKIHKSYCIRVKAIDGVFVSENKVRIGKHLLPLGRNYRNQLLKFITPIS